MGIYGIKSTSCKCRGSWATLDSEHRVYIKTPCSEHELTQGNQIYYTPLHIFNAHGNIYFSLIKRSFNGRFK